MVNHNEMSVRNLWGCREMVFSRWLFFYFPACSLSSAVFRRDRGDGMWRTVHDLLNFLPNKWGFPNKLGFLSTVLARACYCQTISVMDWLRDRLQHGDICLEVVCVHASIHAWLYISPGGFQNAWDGDYNCSNNWPLNLTTRTLYRLISKYGCHPRQM